MRTYDNSYIVADPREAYVIETAGHDWVVKNVTGALGISNVYSVETDWARISTGVSDGKRVNFAEAYTQDPRTEGSGARRRARSCSLLSFRSGKIDVETMMGVLCDHDTSSEAPETFQTGLKQGGICVHADEDGTGGNTAASLVADLCADGSRLPVYWCGLYSPCLTLFQPVFIEGQLPPILGMGSVMKDERSPWWLFHKLSRVVREKPGERVEYVRGRWAEMQSELFRTAYSLAEEGRHLIDGGRQEKAEKLLTDFMAGNVRAMLEAVGKSLKNFGGQ